MQGRAPKGTCVLCGEQDTVEHFLRCKRINECRKYILLKDEMRHKAHSQGAPDHLIDTITQVMMGEEGDMEEVPRHAKEVYQTQRRVGWNHFRKGRLIKSWSELKTRDGEGRLRPNERWRTGITRVIVQWLLRKWLIQYDLVRDPEEDYDREDLMERCREWWSNRNNKRLLRVDYHLKQDRHEPRGNMTSEYLREWIKVREGAERAFKRYQPGKGQTTLHKWLVRKEG